ncbi:unnamed protein product [Photorhabdus laumondii subsp. laumondii TTO1]|uniref:Photorhabdus luminescens subsp. laumondii TTO1 complete genome segment 11/17 n=1 Tax=Photorhabdus laumondii subsp. laumondii (strain DSM 15139 / CIP 105565 / TT01) TaxID=243265 RepID=Q7N2S1_PHOLL|nr:unnamed protein product [Photorhabdus laumondii subsp. laumondii TTO1]
MRVLLYLHSVTVMMIDTSQVLEWVKQKYPAIMGKDSNQ